MKMTVCAGVLALATSVCCRLLRLLRQRCWHAPAATQTASIDVARIKSTLRLTPAQEPQWPPVEAALRHLARRQEAEAEAGLFHRVSKRVVQIALTSAASTAGRGGAAAGRFAR